VSTGKHFPDRANNIFRDFGSSIPLSFGHVPSCPKRPSHVFQARDLLEVFDSIVILALVQVVNLHFRNQRADEGLIDQAMREVSRLDTVFGEGIPHVTVLVNPRLQD
jgi:hypothetical protein